MAALWNGAGMVWAALLTVYGVWGSTYPSLSRRPAGHSPSGISPSGIPGELVIARMGPGRRCSTKSTRSARLAKRGSAKSMSPTAAENGNNGPMLDDLRRRRLRGSVFDYVQLTSSPMLPGPLVPAGKPGSAIFPRSVTGRIRADRRRSPRLSFVTMLVCTNDGFTGVDSVLLPRRRGQSARSRRLPSRRAPSETPKCSGTSCRHVRG